jgi:hypothetical protein
MNSRTLLKIATALVLLVAGVIPIACGGGEKKEPTATPTPEATAALTPSPPTSTPAPPRPTAVPLPTYTNPETGASCPNAITQAAIDAAAASNKLTLPLPPCVEMDKPFYAQDYLEGQAFYFYVPKDTPIVSPLTGELINIGAGDVEPLSGDGPSVYILGEEYGAYLLARHANFDSSLFGTTVQRGQVIGTVGDPLIGGQPETSGVSLGLQVITVAAPERVVRLIEAQPWAGNQPNFYAP